ncbi:MAG: plasmid mobilization protein [Alphaproteobacteria bacterium]
MPKPRSEKRLRTRLLSNVRCYPEDKEKIMARAKAKGLSTGGYLRECALRRNIQAKGDAVRLEEIVALGAELKDLYRQVQSSGMTPALHSLLCGTLSQMAVAFQNFTPR